MRSVVKIINPYDAGDLPEDLKERWGIPLSKIVQLGSNENPYPPPNNLLKKCSRALRNMNRYPDPKYRKLKSKISEYLNVNEDKISLGCGASEIIRNICDLFLEPLDKVIIPMPSYTMYILYSMLKDASIRLLNFPYYNIDSSKIDDDFSLLFICSPNNPTGNAIPKSEIKKILKKSSGYVVVDEAYAEFSNQTVVDFVEKYDNLIVIRTFSKFFGLAGLRVGYSISSPEVAKNLEKIRLPFGISKIGYIAAVSALEMVDWFKKIKDKIINERERMISELKKLKDIKVFSSDANFVLIKINKEINLDDFKKQGIIVRNLKSLYGLEGLHIRVSIGLKKENNKFLSIFKSILGE